MKYIVNPVTGEYESTAYTFRDRFSLGGDAQPLETKPEGQVAGALMDAFPKQSFLEYQNAVQEGYQGTMEEFLQMKSNKSELDMEAIEGQTAGALPDLIRLSSDVVDLIKKKNKKTREPQFSSISKTDGKGFKKLDEAEQLFKNELTKKFKNILNDPKTKNLIPKKYRNIKDIREISTKDFQKINIDLRDLQYKKITDEKNIDKFSKLPLTQKNNVKSLYLARTKSSLLPKTNYIKIAGDDFDIPNNIGVLPGQVKNLEKAYSLLKKFDKNPTVDNYYKEVTGKDKGANVLINDIQTYLTGSSKDKSTRPLFERPLQLKFIKSLDLKNKLKPETIQLLKDRKGKKAADLYKIQKGMKEKAAEAVMKKKGPALKKLNEIFKMDPDMGPDELINEFYGDAYLKASKAEQRDMFKTLTNDVVTYYKVVDKTRVKPEGVRLPNEDKLFDIVDNIKYQTGKGGYRFGDGFLRDIKNGVAESITNPGYSYNSKIMTIGRKFPGKHVDHTGGVSAVHEVAPGYMEAIQILNPKINKEKGVLLERPLTKILDNFFTDSKAPVQIKGQKYSFEDSVAIYNNNAKDFAKKYGVDTAIIKFGQPGKGSSPKETVKYFNEFSKGAQKNMMEVWNNHGFTMTMDSRPMGSEFFGKTYKARKTNKNMGGMVEVMDNTLMMAKGGRVNFENGTGSLSFSDTETDNFINMAIAADQNDNIPIEDKTFLGMKIADNPLQKFNEIIDPRAYPYYGQKIAQGGSRIPEYMFRTLPALLQGAYDIGTKRPEGKLDRFIDKISPKITDKIQDTIGLTKLIKDTEKNRTESQKQYGEGLEFLAEVPGPATPLGLLYKTPKFIRQIRGIAGSATAAKELETKIKDKLDTVDQGRRDTLLAIGATSVVGLVKALGLDKLIPVGSKVVQKTAPIVTPGGTPKYFFDFVDLIKKSGDDITEKASTLERQKVYDYNGYTMYEDLNTGEIRINKTNEGMASGYDNYGEVQQYDTITGQEEIIYRPGEIIKGKDGKATKTLDEYEEATSKPVNLDGDMEGETGLDSIEEILDLLSKDGKKYSKTELEDMGIDIEAFGNSPTGAGSVRLEDLVKPKKAGGGIMKLAGDDSGPPPTSGPNSQGLALILKRAKQY